MVSTGAQSAVAAAAIHGTPPPSSDLDQRLIKTETAPRVAVSNMFRVLPTASTSNASVIKAETVPGHSPDGSLLAPRIKLEEEEAETPLVATPQVLVQYSSSPPPLVEDCFSFSGNSFALYTGSEPDLRSEKTALHDERKLAAYEYAELAERNGRLQSQHGELLKLASTYNDIIYGTSSLQEPAFSIDQLRVEAGNEGLRAKALEADVLRPLIHEAGGLQALLSSIDSVRSLIDEAGGLQELRDLVSDTQLLRISVDEVGGLQGLHNLISEVDNLRSEQQAYVQLQTTMGDINKLKSKAAKYDRLKVTFAEIIGSENVGTVWTGPPIKTKLTPTTPAGINPARARLMSAPVPEDDPDRDLYEARSPLANNTWKKTGSNDIPLGDVKLQALTRPAGQTANKMPGHSSKKRKHDQGHPVNAKRPRIDIGRASALLQASLITNHTGGSSLESLVNTTTRGSVIKSEEAVRPFFAAPVTSIAFMGVSGPPFQGTGHATGTTGQLLPEGSSNLETVPAIQQTKTVAPSFRPYPIALWTGPEDPIESSPLKYLRRPMSFPPALGEFLIRKLKEQVSVHKIHLFNTMAESCSVCILSSLVEGTGERTSHARERMTCTQCYSRHRPCALLQSVGGIKTIVFLPIQRPFRYGVGWNDQRYYVV
ncbi:hypothetical protein NX059_004810 [Plenodomus lindquistii]|nr:hypothetical protein NX059_004810 [Plenodomus lindquistii]